MAKVRSVRVPAKCRIAFCEQQLLLPLVGALHGAQQIELDAVLPRGRHQRLHVLGEAAAAVADPREQEGVPDAAIRAHPLAHLIHVRPHALAEAARCRS